MVNTRLSRGHVKYGHVRARILYNQNDTLEQRLRGWKIPFGEGVCCHMPQVYVCTR